MQQWQMHSIKEVQTGMEIFQTLKGEKSVIAHEFQATWYFQMLILEKRDPTFEQTQ